MPRPDRSNEESNPRKGEDNYGLLFANEKRTYDEMQQESLETIRHCRQHFDSLISNAQAHLEEQRKLANLALAQAIGTRGVAADRVWNVDEQGYTARSILSDETFRDALKSMVVEAVAEALSAKS